MITIWKKKGWIKLHEKYEKKLSFIQTDRLQRRNVLYDAINNVYNEQEDTQIFGQSLERYVIFSTEK